MKAGITILDADGHALDGEAVYQQYLEPPFHERGRFVYPVDGFDRNQGGRLGRRPADAQALLADMDVEGMRIPVAALEDVIRLKKAAGRPKDRAELEILGALLEEIERNRKKR